MLNERKVSTAITSKIHSLHLVEFRTEDAVWYKIVVEHSKLPSITLHESPHASSDEHLATAREKFKQLSQFWHSGVALA